MKLYTVDRAATLSEESTLILFSDPRQMPYYEVPNLISMADLKAHLAILFPEGLSNHGWQYIKQRHTHGENPNFFTTPSVLIELVFESVRRSDFPHRPSRFQALFACKTLIEAQAFKLLAGSPEAPIFEIDADVHFTGDMNWLQLGVQNIAGWFMAYQYWQGSSTANPWWETVASLPLKIGKNVTSEQGACVVGEQVCIP